MLYFIRHALDDESYVGSWSDVSILESEVPLVLSKAQFIRDNLLISGIISSDILRARETAEIISKVLNLSVFFDPNLREQNKGVLSGRLRSSLSDWEKFLLDNQEIDTVFLGGESLIDVYQRIKEYLPVIGEFPDGTLIVTHRGVINMLYYILTDTPLDMDKGRFAVGHLSIHEYDRGKRLIKKIG